MFKIRPGISELHFDAWPRIDDSIASWREFRSVRDQGVIPAGLRFQIGLPFPSSALSGFKADFAGDYPAAERAYEDLVGRELVRLLYEIPAADLAIQWDMAYEVQDIEGVLAWTSEGAWERFAGPVARLTPQIPEDVIVGYHLGYGTFPEWPMYEARDYDVLVRMANHAVANSGRSVDWVHMAGLGCRRCASTVTWCALFATRSRSRTPRSRGVSSHGRSTRCRRRARSRSGSCRSCPAAAG